MTPEIRVCSVWSRDITSEDDREKVFHRKAVEGRCDVGKSGLTSDMSFPKLDRAKKVSKDPSERAILVQTKKHYQELREHFQSLKPGFSGETAALGETLIVEGCDATSVCVGDIFQSTQSSLSVQVTFPRLACMRPDKLHPLGLQSGQPGTVRQWVSANGRGGFFLKVLTNGDISSGDSLQLTKRTQPAWSMERLSSLCYPTTPLQMSWAGTHRELETLCSMDELGVYEWKERLQEIRAKSPSLAETVEIRPEAMSGDGSIANVGIKLDGTFQCPHCRQKFLNDLALTLHYRFIHDPSRHQED
eukprot:TRINITY_DN106828_c0_g1_i1.p1 TRINITY_DN106828_c0_g1~~TRINITY_DN106828_c0_g1_i1.p1  ORF type:complete len:303 (-),score=47.22 TRINITY_DN106828_c0_g1_i1:197-1105(-)